MILAIHPTFSPKIYFNELRHYEKTANFEDDFIQAARSVYRLNDKRAEIKKTINILYGSGFIEEKSYE